MATCAMRAMVALALCALPSLVEAQDPGEGTEASSSSSPKDFASIAEYLYFPADDGLHGRELWQLDSRSLGGALAADIEPGAQGSNPDSFCEMEGHVVFRATTAACGTELWVYEPVARQAHLVADIMPGPAGSDPRPIGMGQAGFYFVAQRAPECFSLHVMNPRDLSVTVLPVSSSRVVRGIVSHNGLAMAETTNALWRSDGTVAGTQVIRDFGDAEGRVFEDLIPLGEKAFFTAFDTAHGTELWVTDGTSQGTQLLRDIFPGPQESGASEMSIIGDLAYFQADDGEHGVELWRTDGTPQGTVLVQDICPGVASSDPYQFVQGPGGLFFKADDGVHGVELWRLDDISQKADLVADLDPGPQGSGPWRLTPFAERLFFCANSSIYGEEVFVTDGHETHILLDVVPGKGPSGPHNLTEFARQLVFTCDDGIHGEELWISGGKAENTRLLLDIRRPPAAMNPSSAPRSLTPLGDNLLFVANDVASGAELWLSDGTAEGTRLLRDINAGSADSAPSDLVFLGDIVCFSAEDGESGRELWLSDGTPEGTRLACDLRPGAYGSDPRSITPIRDGLVFIAEDATRAPALWNWNRRTGAVRRVFEEGDNAPEANIVEVFACNGATYFYAREGATLALWRTDGSKEGSERLGVMPNSPGAWLERQSLSADRNASIDPVPPSLLIPTLHPPLSEATPPVVVGRWIYFAGYTPALGAELWRTDGTSAGTTLVGDCYPGAPSSSPTCLAQVGDSIYFLAEHPSQGCVVWRTDGTPETTRMISYGLLGTGVLLGPEANTLGVFPGVGALLSAPYPIQTRIEDPELVILVHKDEVDDFEIQILNTSTEGSWPRQFTPVGDRVFFTADDGLHGEELWVIENKPPLVARMVKDIITAQEQANN